MNPLKSALRTSVVAALFLAPTTTLLIAADASASAPVAAATELPPLQKQKFHAGPWEHDIGYTQAVRVGNTLYVSGSVGAGEMPAALKQAYDKIARTLAAHQLGFGHVVKENVFTTDIEALKAHKAVRNAYYGTDFPAATWVQVSRLFRPEHVLEVEVTAVFPDEKPIAK